MKEKSSLTEKQTEFCHQYTIDLNGKQAAIRSGYSPRTAEVQAARLLSKAKVREYLTRLQAKARTKTDLSRERVEYELKCILDAKISDYMTFDGNRIKWKSFEELTENQIKAIESIKENRHGMIEMKLHGRTWSIDRVCKLMGYDSATDLNIQLQNLEEKAIDLIISKLLSKNK